MAINFSATKEELARRRNAKMNHAYNATHVQLRRWAEREREDERFARSIGVTLTYDQVRHPGLKLWR